MSDLLSPEQICEVLGLFEIEYCDALFWRTDDDGGLRLFVEANDLFYWGTADVEEISANKISSIAQAKADLEAATGDDYDFHFPSLAAARLRGMRPQRPCYRNVPDVIRALYDSCGPERNREDEG